MPGEIDRLHQAISALNRGDVSDWLAQFASDACVRVPGASYQSKVFVRMFFEDLVTNYGAVQYEVAHIRHLEGKLLAMGTRRSFPRFGQPSEAPLTLVVRFDAGRIALWQEFDDPDDPDAN